MSLTRQEVADIRENFPILNERVYDNALVYLDNGATTQKPQSVIDTVSNYYAHSNSNVHRGVHYLSGKATDAYEAARVTIQTHVNATHSDEIIFVRGTTEAINLVAQTFARSMISEGDEILISALEHHSNIVPWQLLCQQTGAKLVVAPLNEFNEIDIDAFKVLLTNKVKLASFTHISNAIGSINPVKQLVSLCKTKGIYTLIDGAQALPHAPIDVQDLECDFYAFSAHKAYGPTGVGALYGKKALLAKMPPYQGGGDMILQVSFDTAEYNVPPYRFEAGTPNIAGAIGFAAALDYINQIGLQRIEGYEAELFAYAKEQLSALDKITLYSLARDNSPVLSFTHAEAHPHDIGTILDQEGVAIRAGHHCSMPLLDLLGVNATVRASFSFYNTFEEIDKLIMALETVEKLFQ
jgi:cysteine desulfurase/selenocysteine lyase